MRLLLPVAAILLTTLLRAQDPLRTLPGNYRTVLENEYVRVIHVTYAPHETLPIHDHPKTPTIYAYLADSGPVRFQHVEEQAFALVRRPVKAGTFRVSPGRVEIHSVENLGDVESEFLRIELRRIPLGFQSSSFRGTKPFDLTKSSISEEFRCPLFQIQRIIAVGDRPEALARTNKASLIVAFAPALITVATGKLDGFERGDVRWLGEGQHFAVSGTAGTPAHLLRIIFDHSRGDR